MPTGARSSRAAPRSDRQNNKRIVWKLLVAQENGRVKQHSQALRQAQLSTADEFKYRGTVSKRATEAEVKKTPGVNFQVRFVNSETNHKLPARFGKGHTGPKKSAFVPLGLTADVWGPEKKWVLLERACSAIGPRVCGVVWRKGAVAADGTATDGHWLGATYEHSDKPLAQRRCYEKDSLLAAAKPVSFEAVLQTLDGVERDNRDFVVVVDVSD